MLVSYSPSTETPSSCENSPSEHPHQYDYDHSHHNRVENTEPTPVHHLRIEHPVQRLVRFVQEVVAERELREVSDTCCSEIESWPSMQLTPQHSPCPIVARDLVERRAYRRRTSATGIRTFRRTRHRSILASTRASANSLANPHPSPCRRSASSRGVQRLRHPLTSRWRTEGSGQTSLSAGKGQRWRLQTKQ